MDTELFRDRVGDLAAYEAFVGTDRDEEPGVMDYEPVVLKTDSAAIALAKQRLGIPDIKEIREWDREAKLKAAGILLREGIPRRQIARITGIGKWIVDKAGDISRSG